MRSTKSPSWIERLTGAGPLAAPPHAFVLDEARLAYGAFAREGGRLRLREFHREPLPADAFLKGPLGAPLRDPAVLDGALGHLLERVGVPVKEAALVLPDAWLRLAFTESAALPAVPREREEVLRWKLRRLVPFRVDELRLDAVEVEPLPGQAGQPEPRRLMLAFAVETLLSQLEDGFARAGIRLGRITCNSLALLAALEPADGRGGLEGVLSAREGEYSLIVAREGEPVLHRTKGLPAEIPAAASGELVLRDLALTRNFLEQQQPGAALTRVVLVAPDEVEAVWLEWLESGLGVAAESLGGRQLGSIDGLESGRTGALAWREIAPLAGAVRMEVV